MRKILSRTLMILVVALLTACSSDEWEWHASDYMVGNWEIAEIETTDGDTFWESNKYDEYPFYFNAISISGDGSFEESILNEAGDVTIFTGRWESEEKQDLCRILVTLDDGDTFEIAWTNSTEPNTIRYLMDDYVFIFRPLQDSADSSDLIYDNDNDKDTDTATDTAPITSSGSDTFDEEGNCFDVNGNWVDPTTDMVYLTVDSSAFDVVGYSERTLTLDLQFDTSGWYRYTNIDSDLYQQFMNADSLGSFYNAYIKGRYPCTELE